VFFMVTDKNQSSTCEVGFSSVFGLFNNACGLVIN